MTDLPVSYDAWKTREPDNDELRCSECGDPASEDDYPYNGGFYHLHCAPVMDCAEVIRADLDERCVAEAVEILAALADDGSRKLRAHRELREISARVAARKGHP